MGTDFTANFDLETVEKPSSTFRLAQTVPTSTVQGLTPTFQARGAQTIIDVTLTARLSVSVTNWTVSQEYNGSDHNTITFQVEQDKQKVEPTWKWHKADWTGFTLALQYNPLRIPPTVTQRTCETLLDDLYKELDKAMKDNIPKTKTKIIDKNNPCLLYTSPSPRDLSTSRMPSSA